MKERNGGVSSIRSWKNVYYMINVLLSIMIIGTMEVKIMPLKFKTWCSYHRLNTNCGCGSYTT